MTNNSGYEVISNTSLTIQLEDIITTCIYMASYLVPYIPVMSSIMFLLTVHLLPSTSLITH